MPSIAVRLDEDLQARLKKIAEIDDRTPHYLMKKAIEAFILDRERQAEEDRISIERWEEFERTGVAVPGEKVFAWIESLADGLNDDANAA